MNNETTKYVSTKDVLLFGGLVPLLGSPALFAIAWWAWSFVEGRSGSVGYGLGGLFGTFVVAPILGLIAALLTLSYVSKKEAVSKGFVIVSGML